MRADFIRRKLQLITDELGRLAVFRDVGYDEFVADDIRDTFLRLPDHGVLSGEFATRIAASAGLRNVIVHEYHDVDHRIVHAAIRSCLGDYVEYVKRVSAWLDRQETAAP